MTKIGLKRILLYNCVGIGMRLNKLNLLLLLILVIVLFSGLSCEKEDIVVYPPDSDSNIWVEEFFANPPPIFPESLLIVDSVVFPDKYAYGEFDNPTPMKSVLYFGWERLSFIIEIFHDDTILVNQYSGRLYKIGDTFRFNLGDTIIQDYGFQYLSSDSLFIYDFMWADSTGPMFWTFPSNHILWKSEISFKTKGIFVRQKIIE